MPTFNMEAAAHSVDSFNRLSRPVTNQDYETLFQGLRLSRTEEVADEEEITSKTPVWSPAPELPEQRKAKKQYRVIFCNCREKCTI